MKPIPEPYHTLLVTLWRLFHSGPAPTSDVIGRTGDARQVARLEHALWQLEEAGLARCDDSGWQLTAKGLEVLLQSGPGKLSIPESEVHAGALSKAEPRGPLSFADGAPASQSARQRPVGDDSSRGFLIAAAIVTWAIAIAMFWHMLAINQYFRAAFGL